MTIAWNPRKELPPFQEQTPWLTEEQLDLIRSEAMADDVAIDVEALCLRTEPEVLQYFEDGGVLPEPVSSITTWLKANVANAAHRNKLDAALCKGFPNLRAICTPLQGFEPEPWLLQ